MKLGMKFEERNEHFHLIFQRYFQCKTNHGVFVPHDKVTLAAREQANVWSD